MLRSHTREYLKHAETWTTHLPGARKRSFNPKRASRGGAEREMENQQPSRGSAEPAERSAPAPRPLSPPGCRSALGRFGEPQHVPLCLLLLCHSRSWTPGRRPPSSSAHWVPRPRLLGEHPGPKHQEPPVSGVRVSQGARSEAPGRLLLPLWPSLGVPGLAAPSPASLPWSAGGRLRPMSPVTRTPVPLHWEPQRQRP